MRLTLCGILVLEYNINKEIIFKFVTIPSRVFSLLYRKQKLPPIPQFSSAMERTRVDGTWPHDGKKIAGREFQG
jgi:hypothetical protein